MWVIKLGGSLLGSPELLSWLALIAKYSDGKVVIVPGGGLFADSVREAQQISNMNDALAHQLALLAMDQYGLLLAGLQPQLVTASSELEISERGWQHLGIVWLPSKMVLADEHIPKNWQVTSDSLAAWLAKKLGAEHLVMVKSAPLLQYQTQAPTALQHLVNDEVLDPQFTQTIAGQPYATWVLNKADFTIFEHGFDATKLAQTGLRL
jgi:aspartokinase-like uncharacterized kinase